MVSRPHIVEEPSGQCRSVGLWVDSKWRREERHRTEENRLRTDDRVNAGKLNDAAAAAETSSVQGAGCSSIRMAIVPPAKLGSFGSETK